MNKTRYRVIFNKARGMLMAVAETTKSQGKSAGQTHATAQSPEQHVEVTSLDGVWHLKALVASMSLLMAVGPTYAGTVSQIKADTTAKAENQATIGKASNGTPVVGIQTPNAKGVSHNVYTQFDVGSNGVVLNNSRTGATSQLAGTVGANSWLAKGEASVIVNEINSSSASRFEGNLEVAGRMADVIIANPSGINVKGGGFINVNTATLTTGKPVYAKDGTLTSYQIKQGTISVAQDPDTQFGLGDNGNAPNYAEILARAVDINAKVQAKQDINVVTGSNTVAADLQTINTLTGTGTAPTIGLDVKELGSMYANSIYVVGTATGLGVKNAGTFNAVNNLIVTSAGKIENAGTISQTSKTQGMLSLTTTQTKSNGDINNSGTISSRGLMNIDAKQDINVTAGAIRVEKDVVSPLIMSAERNVNVGASAAIKNYASGGDIYISAAGITLKEKADIGTNGGVALNATGNVSLATGSKVTGINDVSIVAQGNIAATGAQLLSRDENVYLQASKPAQASAATSTSTITLTDVIINAAKDFTNYADSNISLTNLIFTKESDGTARVDNLKAYAGNDLTLKNTTQALPSLIGNIELTAGNNISLSSTLTNPASTELKATGGIQVKGNSLTTKNIKLSADKNIELIADGGNIVLDSNTQLSSTAGNINISALTGDITGRSLNASANSGLISILAKENVTLESDKIETAVSGASFKKVTYSANNITAKKGINIGSVGSGSVNLSYSLLDSSDGTLNISAGQDINIIPEMNTAAWALSIGNTTQYIPLPLPNINLFSANEVKVTSGGAINGSSTILTADKGDISFSAIKGLTLTAIQSSSSKNTTFSSGTSGILTLVGINANANEHMVLSSGDQIYINSHRQEKKDTNGNTLKDAAGKVLYETNWDYSAPSSFTSNGVFSVKSKYWQSYQNTNIKAGAINIDSGSGFSWVGNNKLETVETDLLKDKIYTIKDISGKSIEKSLSGSLSIRSKSSLTIDPKVLALSAVGNIDLVSTSGTLTLKGYSGSKGNSSEQVVNLKTDKGGIYLEGKDIKLQGSQLIAKNDINIITNAGELNIDGIKNTFTDIRFSTRYNELKSYKNSLDTSLNLIGTSGYLKDFKILQDYAIFVDKNSNASTLAEFSKRYQSFRLKYPIESDGLNNNENLGFALLPPLFYFKDIFTGGLLDAKYVFRPRYDQTYLNELQDNINLYNSNLNGYEHTGSTIASKSGNIKIASKGGLSISGAKVSSDNGAVSISSEGILTNNSQPITQNLNALDQKGKSITTAASIVIDGLTNFYDKGKETDPEYLMRSFVKPTEIIAKNNIEIRSTGTSDNDNIILQGVSLESKAANVSIESGKNLYFDVAIEESYDKTTSSYKKKSWGGLKKKTVTTVSTNGTATSSPVEITAKNDITVQSGGNMNIFSTNFDAGRNINIKAAGNLNFLTSEEQIANTQDIKTSKSFAGLKYNKTTTNATRNQVSQLPSTLTASSISTKSGLNTVLAGTEFNYLQFANIEANGTITFIGAKNLYENTYKKESNSVVWQSMVDKGSVKETSTLPSFNGPIAPKFSATGGLIIQVPQSEKDANKIALKDAIVNLSKQPGNKYLADLIERKDVNWQQVILTDKEWNYKQQGLTAAGAAILAIIVAAATAGAGITSLGTTTALSGGGSVTTFGGLTLATTTATGATTITAAGTMLNAAFTSIASQASVSLVNNKGDIAKTLNDLGSKESVKSLAITVVTAGLLSGVATNLNISSNAAVNDIANNMANGMIQGVGSTLIDSAVNGGNLSEGLERALLAGLANSLQAPLAGAIGDTLGMSSNVFVSKVAAIAAHAAAGCATGVVDKQCQSRALGAALGEVIAENMFKPANGIEYTDAEQLKIRNISKLTTGLVAAYTHYDVTAAANAADTAVSNNYLSHVQEKQRNQEFKDCSGVACTGVILKWAAIDAGQDASYATGFAAGIPTAVGESVIGLVKMGLSPIQTYKAIKDIISSENALGTISNAVKQDYINRINQLEADYQKAGTNGAYNAGLETGKLATDVVSLLAGGAGLAKGGVILTEKVAAKIGYKVLKDPVIISDKGVPVSLDGHKIYDPNFAPLSTRPDVLYRFSDPVHRPTGGDVYFGENIATSYFEVRQAVNGKSLFVGQVEVKNVLDLTDPKILKQMGIDQKKLTEVAPDGFSTAEKTKKAAIYDYTNSIANQAYDKGYSGIIYNSSRNANSTNNRAVVLFGDRYDPTKINPVLDKPILTK